MADIEAERGPLPLLSRAATYKMGEYPFVKGSPSSLITVKTHKLNPLEWKPTDTLLVDAKKATAAYNKGHFNCGTIDKSTQ